MMPQITAPVSLSKLGLSPQAIASRIALLSLFILPAGCEWLPKSDAQTRPPGAEQSDGPVAVETAIAQTGSLTAELEYTGTTEPSQRVALKAQAEGQLLDLTVDVGDPIRRGQVLARIDAQLLSAGVGQARSELAARESEVAQARSQVNDAQTRVEQARVALQQAQADANRLRFLAEQGAFSQQDAELAQTELQTAQQALRSAQEQVATAQQGVVAAQGRVQAQQAVVQETQERLSYTTVVSPISGVVLERLAESGDFVQTGGDVFALADFSAVKVKVQVSELDLANLRVGQSVQVRLDAFPEENITGEVSRISPAADPTARLIPVEVTIPNRNGRIGSGLLARVRFAQSAAASVVVPESALAVGEGESTLFVIAGEGSAAKAQARTVQIGDRANRQVEIRSGLKPGEAFVVRSSRSLKEGEPVRLSILSET